MNVKELFENKELMENIVEDIEDIPEDSEVQYSVWGICYNEDDECVDSFFIEIFDDPDEAISCAKDFSLERFNADFAKPISDTTHLAIEVETVVANPEEEDETMNIGTIYSRDLWLDGEYGFEEDIDPVVELKTTDFELTEDGELKVSCKLLKDFNKNDYLRVRFVDEAETGTFLYKITSKVIYKDGDYYHCEMIL